LILAVRLSPPVFGVSLVERFGIGKYKKGSAKTEPCKYLAQRLTRLFDKCVVMRDSVKLQGLLTINA